MIVVIAEGEAVVVVVVVVVVVLVVVVLVVVVLVVVALVVEVVVVVVVVVEELQRQEALQLKPASQAFAFEVSFQVYRKIPEGIRKAMHTTLRGFSTHTRASKVGF